MCVMYLHAWGLLNISAFVHFWICQYHLNHSSEFDRKYVGTTITIYFGCLILFKQIVRACVREAYRVNTLWYSLITNTWPGSLLIQVEIDDFYLTTPTLQNCVLWPSEGGRIESPTVQVLGLMLISHATVSSSLFDTWTTKEKQSAGA